MNSINLDDLLKNGQPVYVMNRSNPRGDVTVTVFRPDGTPYLITVPKTWIPICVTDQVSHDTLKASDDFRRNCSSGMLQLMTPKHAAEKLKDPDAKEELARLNVSKFSSFDDDLLKETNTIEAFNDSLESTDNVSVTVKEILFREVPEKEKYHLLRSDEDLLTEDDFKYIALNAGGKIQKWAEEKIQA